MFEPRAWARARVRGTAALLALCLIGLDPAGARAFRPEILESVVSVLPLWPGHARGGQPGLPPGTAPEGTAVAILPGGYLITALHVVERALDITIRLPDGRHVPATLAGADSATDLALLKTAAALPILPDAPEPALGAPVCAVGNQFGLGLSVTCGVVSALHRTGTGFNPVEDFVQTDASANPGISGGALVDAEGRLVGIVSAIFTMGSDADIGVNFAASIALVRRVAVDLAAHGRVRWAESGLGAEDLSPAERDRLAGVRVARVDPHSAAERAGFARGDIVQRIGARAIRRASDLVGALALARPGERLRLEVRQGAAARWIELALPP